LKDIPDVLNHIADVVEASPGHAWSITASGREETTRLRRPVSSRHNVIGVMDQRDEKRFFRDFGIDFRVTVVLRRTLFSAVTGT